MWFARTTEIAETSKPEGEGGWPTLEGAALNGDVVAWFSPSELTRFILGRVCRAMAAAAHFSVARASELHAVNDAIAEYAELAADGHLGVAITSSSRRLSLTGGPFLRSVGDDRGGVAQASDELDHRKQHLAGTVDRLCTEALNDAELLHLVLVDTPPATCA